MVKTAQIPWADSVEMRLDLVKIILVKIKKDKKLICMRVIQADEILEKIVQSKPVEYKNVIVEGDLDLSKLKKDEDGKFRIRSSIKIENSDILGIVNIENTAIPVSANFKSTKFEQNNN